MCQQNQFLLIYASQTGQAKAIAEEIENSANKEGLTGDIYCASKLDKDFEFEDHSCVIFVVSTTGDGEPPETALKFWRKLKKISVEKQPLKHLQYSLLGLGDTNYTNFCNFGKILNERLLKLGAQHFYPAGFADDGTGLEIIVEPWLEGLWPALKKHLQGVENCPPNDLDINLISMEMQNTVKYSISGTDESNPKKDNSLKEMFNVSLEKKTDLVLKKGITEMKSDYSLEEQKHPTVDNRDEDRDYSTSLTLGSPILHEVELNLPSVPLPYLDIEYLDEEMDICPVSLMKEVSWPFSRSEITIATVIKAKQLTADDAVKTTLNLVLELPEDKAVPFESGNTIGVICPNRKQEVDWLIKRLNLSTISRKGCKIKVLPYTKKKSAAVPKYLPSHSTPEYLLTYCCNIRDTPKKLFLRCLVEYTTESDERNRLKELCSREGRQEYSKFIQEPALTFLKLLSTFPSCQPPLERLLEHLNRLVPRPYSIACSPLVEQHHLHIVFNVVEKAETDEMNQPRNGLCTGWLKNITCDITAASSKESLNVDLSRLTLKDPPQIPVYFRECSEFHLPNDHSVPMVLIGPGTGIAPFIGFLQHREIQKKLTPDMPYGEIWLFFGCRHYDRDFLFREELLRLLSCGVLSQLLVSFSRYDPSPLNNSNYIKGYVQDNIRLHAGEFVKMLLDRSAVYVCGDAKNMAKSVRETIVELLQTVQGMSSEEATNFMTQMKERKRYLEDIWT